jgi:threonine aldolase
MYIYALRASLADDVYFEPTTDSLENHIAKLTGKEAALFVPSGTMGNQISLRTHLAQPPYSVLYDYRSHINQYVSADSFLDQFSPRIDTRRAGPHFTLELIPLPSFRPTENISPYLM